RPAASVHPEPGSNSSLYKIIINLSLSPDALFQFLRIDALDHLSNFSVLACTYLSVFSMNFPVRFKRDCKGNTFFLNSKLFLKIFLKI
ncbi:MAG: hypothetical protein MJZ09_07890, partial [Bacteroidales bacterium]|nr:hypothetical protein [Bacteroidales bacterium]